MPLTISRPGRGDYLPLIEKIERRLQGWQGKMLSRGGRFQLMESVLAAIPIYHMTCFLLPRWVLNRIDSICRNFLWGKTDMNKRGISLINWGVVCMPRRYGGMGAANIELRNMALVLRWWWKAYTEPGSLWTTMVSMLRGIATQTDGPRLWLVQGSFFWRQLIKLKSIFHWSTQYQIGNGASISFLYDNWNGKPLRSMKDGQPRPVLQAISLSDAAVILHVLLPGVEGGASVTFNEHANSLIWRWSSNGIYSASSIYRIMVTSGLIKDRCCVIWKYPAPIKVKIFTFLLLKNRLLTHEILERRGMQCEMRCMLCETCNFETAHHLFLTCTYARRIWAALDPHTPNFVECDTLEDIWYSFEMKAARCTQQVGVKRRAVFMAGVWYLWRERHRIFRENTVPPEVLVMRIREEANLWKQYCGGRKGREGIG